MLFLGHDVHRDGGKATVSGAYVADLLSDDWGFWYDAVTNLGKVKSLVDHFNISEDLPMDRGRLAVERVDRLLQMIADAPKSRRWEKRARAGTAKPWFKEVEEVAR